MKNSNEPTFYERFAELVRESRSPQRHTVPLRERVSGVFWNVVGVGAWLIIIGLVLYIVYSLSSAFWHFVG